MDMLNPIQPASMDRAEIKRDFGDKLCFWGSIDEHYSLPFGSPEEIRREVKERLTTMGKKGGLILAPTHHVQLDTPMENFLAMQQTITQTAYAELSSYHLIGVLSAISNDPWKGWASAPPSEGGGLNGPLGPETASLQGLKPTL